MNPEVKICGLTRREDALSAAEAGAGYLGFVLVSDSPRAVSVEEVRTIRDGIDVPLALVTADRDPDSLVEAARTTDARILQLHGSEPPEDVERLREAGDWVIWKSVRLREVGDMQEALDRFDGLVDAIHLDGWHPRRLGGTGIRFPWREVAGVRDRIPSEMGLVAAGGLTPANVAEAIRLLRPDVVDVSSGVEARPGIKDPTRIRAFIHAAASTRPGGAASGGEEGPGSGRGPGFEPGSGSEPGSESEHNPGSERDSGVGLEPGAGDEPVAGGEPVTVDDGARNAGAIDPGRPGP